MIVAVMQWTEAEKAGFLPFIKEHEMEGTKWNVMDKLWMEKFGTKRTAAALRGRLNRCKLDGSYQPDKTFGPRSSPTDVNTQTRTRGRPVKPQRSPQTERIRRQSRSVWSVSPDREPSPALSLAPTGDGSTSLPPRSPERPALKNHGKEPNVPLSEEDIERLDYCAAFCKFCLDVYSRISKQKTDTNAAAAYSAMISGQFYYHF